MGPFFFLSGGLAQMRALRMTARGCDERKKEQVPQQKGGPPPLDFSNRGGLNFDYNRRGLRGRMLGVILPGE
jgi:hypothetical protein